MEANALEQRQLLPGLGLGPGSSVGLGLGSIVQNAAGAKPTGGLLGGVTGVVGGLTSDLGSVAGGLTSDLGAITSSLDQGVSSILSSVLTTSTSTTSSSSISSSPSSTATSTTESLSSLSTPSVTFSPSSTTDSQSITETPLADSGTQTVTNFISFSSTPSSTPSAAAAAPKGFLQNKPLAGAVFGAVGLVVVVLFFIIITWALRRRRRKNLIEDAISFDPSEPHYNDAAGLVEKGRSSIGSDGLGRASSTSHGTYSQYPASIPPNQGYYSARPPQPAQQPYPRYPSPTQMGNQAYDGMGGNGIYYSSNARNVLGSNPPTLRDAGLAFQNVPQTQANTMSRPPVSTLPSTFGSDGGRRSPDEALRGPALKVAN